jgi:hypothetical protein
MFPAGVNFPRRAEVNLTWNSQTLSVNWLTDIGTSGSRDSQEPRGGAH